MAGWLAIPRDLLASFGQMGRFAGTVMGLVYSGRVMRFFGEALRQAGILILGSALEVIGVSPMIFLCATRLLAAWMTLAFVYLGGIAVMYFASYIAVVEQIGEVSSGGYFLIFLMFQNPPDLIFSLVKAMAMATAIVIVGCYYGYTAFGRPAGA